MLRKNQPALQIFEDGEWKFVFCYSGDTGKIITTKKREKALNADFDLDFFQNKYGDYRFKSDYA